MNKEIDVLALAKQGLLSASHRLDSSNKQLRLLAKEEVDKILELIELYASSQPVAVDRDAFLEGYEAAQSDANFCDVPTQGWLCTRQAGHDGPCAAIADDKGRELVNRAMLRLADQEAAPVQQAEQEPVENSFEAQKSAFDALKERLSAENWTAGETCNFFGFFCWGWDYALGRFSATHPVRTKDLTDVEVEKVWRKHGGYMVVPIDFARAVIAADREKNK